MKLLQACTWARVCVEGNGLNTRSAPGENPKLGLSDRGSTPLASTIFNQENLLKQRVFSFQDLLVVKTGCQNRRNFGREFAFGCSMGYLKYVEVKPWQGKKKKKRKRITVS